MVQGVLGGLREMHAKNIMHRDLKPENILLRTDSGFDCVIADYGLAEFAAAEEYLFVRCGTPGYVAPEVINIKDMKAKYSPVCDIFSLGLIFHVLLFGRSVFKGKTYSEVLAENRACAFDLGSPDYDQVDTLTMDLLRKMLKINPEERITAEQALSHPYFQQSPEEVQGEEELAEEMDKVEIGQSPLMTSGNAERKQAKDLKRDSCLNFVMGKDNILTGKTETMGTVGSAKISGFGAGLLKGLKASKFVKPETK
jgi:calcium-dependent protein kinase